MGEAKSDLKERVRTADMATAGPVRAFADQGERIREQLQEKLEALGRHSVQFDTIVLAQDEIECVVCGDVSCGVKRGWCGA